MTIAGAAPTRPGGDDRVESALAALARGRPVVVVADDQNRSADGNLILAAEHATPAALAFMVRRSNGYVCVSMPDEHADHLDLPLMAPGGDDPHGNTFTVTVDAATGITTGISATDRARTIRALADPNACPQAFTRPGHVLPLRARPGGVLARPGHTEAAGDLCQLAGLQPVGVLAAITNDDGTMTRGAELERLAADHHLGLLDVADIVAYRRRREMLVRREASTRLSTRHGEFTAVGYRSSLDHTEHLTLVMGDITATADPVLVRVHSECPIGDVFGSTRCDCGEHLAQAMARIGAAGRGIVVYLRGHPGHKIGLTTNDYDLQERGTITLDANLAQGPPVDSRDYTDAAHILRELKVTSARLLTNNPDKQRQIAAAGIPIACREPLLTTPAAATTAHIWPNGPACALTTRAPQRCSDTPATRESSPP